MSNHLRPEVIVDKNGVITTRHKNVDIRYDDQGRVSSLATTVSTRSYNGVGESSAPSWDETTPIVNNITEALADEDDTKLNEILGDHYGYSEEQVAGLKPVLESILSDNSSKFEYNEVHWRMYNSHRHDVAEPTDICVQDFDYYDYNRENMIGNHRFHSEEEAKEAIKLLDALLY